MDISMYGHSDDLVVVIHEGFPPKEYYCNGTVPLEITLSQNEGACGTRIWWEYGYGDAAVWSVRVEPMGEKVPMIPVTIHSHPNGYSPLIVANTDPSPGNATVVSVSMEPQ